MLDIRPAGECRYDAVALGEVMLRLDPGDGRIRTARRFDVWEGGGEYNVARGLRRCFRLRTAVVTGLVDNDVGRLVEDLMLQGGVDTSFVRWVPSDGVGRQVRNGLNFTERGFGTLGVRWLHTGGIYVGLSEVSAQTAEAAMTAARRHGTIVSYDLNYRPSIWAAIGGVPRAQEVNQRLARHVDVMIGNEEDFTACLGLAVPDTDIHAGAVEPANFSRMITELISHYPHLEAVATTLRGVRSASVNDWGAIAWSPDVGFVETTRRPELAIFDRIGGGDSFASGFIYALLQGWNVATAVEYGAAHGALAMTTPGDTSMASLDEVTSLVRGTSARVQR